MDILPEACFTIVTVASIVEANIVERFTTDLLTHCELQSTAGLNFNEN